MSKLPVNLECPGDIYFNKIVYVISPWFYSVGFTPNGITTISLIWGIFAAYMVYNKNFIGGSVAHVIAYLFDCLDGYYARTYNQVTKFGDYYDHYSDVFKLSLMFYALFSVDPMILLYFSPILLIGGLLMSVFLGCQEVYYNKKDESAFLGGLIFSSQMTEADSIQYLKWMRYFGPGNYILLIVGILACYQYQYGEGYECPLQCVWGDYTLAPLVAPDKLAGKDECPIGTGYIERYIMGALEMSDKIEK